MDPDKNLYSPYTTRVGARRLRQEQAKRLASGEPSAGEVHTIPHWFEVNSFNTELENKTAKLDSILEDGLSELPFRFDLLRVPEELPSFVPPQNLTAPAVPPVSPREPVLPTIEPHWAVKPLTGLERILGLSGRYERDLRAAEARARSEQSRIRKEYEFALADYKSALANHAASERERRAHLERLRTKHEQANLELLAQIHRKNEDANELEVGYHTGEQGAIVAFCCSVLNWSLYPDDFPQEFRLAYLPASKELVIDYQLPGLSCIPDISEYRHIKSRNVVETKKRKRADVSHSYQSLIAAICLRTLGELFGSDYGAYLSVIVFNGYVNAVDPATGADIRPYLISVRVTKDRFSELDLRRIETRACLRNLGAQVSPQASELLPVKPLIEFEMVDKRFVEQGNVLAELDARPNLMDLTPWEFEHLVGNLFSKMGLDAKLTRSHRDGGVDVIAYDTRPILGGKVVIQAKRYRHTVGVAAVRDLFGTMNHEGANKGILVTTSSYGPDAYDFVRNKPIELIDGGVLLYHLEKVGVKARIVMPPESEPDILQSP